MTVLQKQTIFYTHLFNVRRYAILVSLRRAFVSVVSHHCTSILHSLCDKLTVFFLQLTLCSPKHILNRLLSPLIFHSKTFFVLCTKYFGIAYYLYKFRSVNLSHIGWWPASSEFRILIVIMHSEQNFPYASRYISFEINRDLWRFYVKIIR